MPDTLGRLLFEYSGQVRRYRARETAQIESIAGLSERDIAILEFINSKKQTTFGEINQELHLSDMPKSSASTVSQAISALFVERGLVEKRFNPQDQRQPIISLTKKGQALVEEILQVRRNILTKVKETLDLDQDGENMLREALNRGIENFDKLLSQSGAWETVKR